MMEQIFHFAKCRLKAASGTIVIGVSGIGFSGSCHTSARSAAALPSAWYSTRRSCRGWPTSENINVVKVFFGFAGLQ